MLEIIAYLGNPELLKLPKTAFLCSRQVPAGVMLKCYDWAIAQRGQATASSAASIANAKEMISSSTTTLSIVWVKNWKQRIEIVKIMNKNVDRVVMIII
jgi:hypothetical protein